MQSTTTQTLTFIAALATSFTSCTEQEAPPFDNAALFAGRERITIAYDANLWGELTECG